MSLRRAAPLLPLLLALSACVTFESAPVARLACDPALAGEWRPLGQDGPDRPIVVSAECALRWPEHDGGVYAATLAGFTLGGSRYLVFEPAVADRLMSADGDLARNAPEGSVFLVRYRVDGDSAVVWLADPDEALRPSAGGAAAAVRLDASRVHVKGDREAIARLLRARGETLFAGTRDDAGGEPRGVLRLRRAGSAAAP